MDAQKALDSLLGHLSTVLVNEAQLLGGVRGDVEFIKDEMESMNGLLLHLTEANHQDHQVRAWMKQVVGLTRDCDSNVELYIQYVTGAGLQATGLLGYLRWVLLFVQTIPARHRIATRIQELKVRARDVGDRRQRYGVIVPPAADHQDDAIFIDIDLTAAAPRGEEEDAQRRALSATHVELSDDEENYVERVIECLSEEAPDAAAAGDAGSPQPRVIPILWNMKSPLGLDEKELADSLAAGVYNHSSMATSFDCKAWVDVRSNSCLDKILQETLTQVAPGRQAHTPMTGEVITDVLNEHLKGKCLLIVLEDAFGRLPWDRLRSSLSSAHDITTNDEDVVNSYSPYKIFKSTSMFHVFYRKAMELTRGKDHSTKQNIEDILRRCYPEVIAMKIFLHLLYVNPTRSRTQEDNFVNKLSDCGSSKMAAKQMVRLSYNDHLPTKYRSCLLYLTVSSENGCIRRTDVSRRWIAEGLIATRENNRAEDEADRCFDALVSWGLISPCGTSDAGKIKTYEMHHVVREVITRIAKDVNLMDTDLPRSLARRLSIHNRIGLQASHLNHPMEADDGSAIVPCLEYLAKSPQWQLLKLLDLEGCRGLKKHHLKIICKILLLRYLSLRNTDVAQLPKQIEKLRCLETLDIRQTAVRALATKSIMLPMLKHLLAGNMDTPSSSSERFQESFSTVRLPRGVRKMAKLEVLCHVEVAHNVDDLIDVGHLLQLRKLGMILHLHGNNKSALRLLLQQIEKLYGCLRSLSIQVNRPARIEGAFDAEEETTELASPPKLLQSLKITGITSGLPLWIAELDQLAKLALSETPLGEDGLSILGKLRKIRYLKLGLGSYTGSKLCFKKEEFLSLRSLLVEGSGVTDIAFDSGAAPELETIVWSFEKLEAISGVIHLPKLNKLELNGDYDLELVREAIKEHPNQHHLVPEHTGAHHRERQNAPTVVAAPAHAP